MIKARAAGLLSDHRGAHLSEPHQAEAQVRRVQGAQGHGSGYGQDV